MIFGFVRTWWIGRQPMTVFMRKMMLKYDEPRVFLGEFGADFQIQIGGSHGIRVSHPVGGLVGGWVVLDFRPTPTYKHSLIIHGTLAIEHRHEHYHL